MRVGQMFLNRVYFMDLQYTKASVASIAGD